MLFNHIIGLSSLKNTLIASVQHNHVAHAQLFLGQEGGGNLALALAFATYLNCEAPTDTDACGVCSSCQKTKKLAHPDLHLIFPVPSAKDDMAALMPRWREFVAESPYQTLTDWIAFTGAKGNQQGIIPIKEAHGIIGKITLKAFESKYKILVIWQPEQMNVESANALLKILEEPPAQTIFLLVCNDANRLLTTILSRTQRIQIPAFDTDDVVAYLLEKERIDEKRAKQIAYLAEGNLAKARTIAQGEDNTLHTWFADWMRSCYRANFQDLVSRTDAFATWPKEEQKSLMEYALQLFRDMFLFQQGAGLLVRLESDDLTFAQNFAKTLKVNRLEQMVAEVTQAFFHLERNVSPKMVFLDLSLRVARLMRG